MGKPTISTIMTPAVSFFFVGNINFVKFHQLVLKILSENEILTSIKGHNSVTNVRKTTCNNPNQYLVNINAYTKFGKLLSICSQDIDRKQKSDINQGP